MPFSARMTHNFPGPAWQRGHVTFGQSSSFGGTARCGADRVSAGPGHSACAGLPRSVRRRTPSSIGYPHAVQTSGPFRRAGRLAARGSRAGTVLLDPSAWVTVTSDAGGTS
ncbi:conserved hypothetical protein [Actinacidiphila cocklensis]|uniref:Uncharacterized protein n=1 Tax=Actinacidiphila cocklensis TaxID=887465 RepID=A0A9W4EAS9_9ACTN|nr:conserved hypothetical protein [Actinacidiphila cocklensis]